MATLAILMRIRSLMRIVCAKCAQSFPAVSDNPRTAMECVKQRCVHEEERFEMRMCWCLYLFRCDDTVWTHHAGGKGALKRTTCPHSVLECIGTIIGDINSPKPLYPPI